MGPKRVIRGVKPAWIGPPWMQRLRSPSTLAAGALRAEDGAIGDQYALSETPPSSYAQRTQWNVRDADATLILTRGHLAGGTMLTLRLARELDRPFLVVYLDGYEDADKVRQWLNRLDVEALNVAGPRESEQCGIYRRAKAFLLSVFES